MPDRQRRIFIGAMRQCLIDEQMTRGAADDFQHLGVGYSLFIEALNQALTGSLRGHPDTAMQNMVLFTSH